MGKKGSNPPPPRQPADTQRNSVNEGLNVNPSPPRNVRPTPPPPPPPPSSDD